MKRTNNSNAPRNQQLSGDERIVHRTNLRRKKNRRKKIIIRSAICVVFFVVGIVLALTIFFNINQINVSGDAVYSPEDVIEASGVAVGDNLIFLSKDKINDAVTTKLPYVGSVKIKRHLPTTLELIITKTEATYAFVSNGYFTLLDENGKVLEKDLEYVAEAITVINFGEIESAEVGKKIVLPNENSLEKLKTIREAYEKGGLKDVTSIDLSDIYNINLVYQGRITLELGETDRNNLQKKIDLGKAAIDTQNEENELYKGTINLTVEGKGFWSEETSTTEPLTEDVTGENTSTEDVSKEEISTEISTAA